MQEFKNCDTKNVTVDYGQLGHRPSRRKPADQTVQTLPVIADATVQPVGKFHDRAFNVFIQPEVIGRGPSGRTDTLGTGTNVGGK